MLEIIFSIEMQQLALLVSVQIKMNTEEGGETWGQKGTQRQYNINKKEWKNEKPKAVARNSLLNTLEMDWKQSLLPDFKETQRVPLFCNI